MERREGEDDEWIQINNYVLVEEDEEEEEEEEVIFSILTWMPIAERYMRI